MAETVWEVGDQFRGGDYRGYYTGTIVQKGDGLSDDEVLVGRWRVIDGKRTASYLFVKLDSLRYAYKRERDDTKPPKFSEAEAVLLYKRADAAGMEALRAARPTPMVVGTPKNLMGSLTGGDDGGFDEKEPVYYVAGGVCGFAWVTIYPGNSSLARRWKKLGFASPAYKGGMQVWVREGGQSMELKEAYAGAFARVLQEAGVKAYSGSRMD